MVQVPWPEQDMVHPPPLQFTVTFPWPELTAVQLPPAQFSVALPCPELLSAHLPSGQSHVESPAPVFTNEHSPPAHDHEQVPGAEQLQVESPFLQTLPHADEETRNRNETATRAKRMGPRAMGWSNGAWSLTPPGDSTVDRAQGLVTMRLDQ